MKSKTIKINDEMIWRRFRAMADMRDIRLEEMLKILIDSFEG